tara:strand:+ start:764 stop:1858 length:1095 start_codon:yes stop_codon:yes gene_type:complete
MNTKVEFIEKTAESMLDEIVMSLGDNAGSDLVVFEEDLDDDLDGEIGLLEDMEFLEGSDEESAGEPGEVSGDLKPLDGDEWSKEWEEELAGSNPGGLVSDLAEAGAEYVEALNENLEEEGLQVGVSKDGDEFGVLPIPGSEELFDDKEQENAAADLDWENDRDSSMFMPYLENSYPSGIPSHDGNSMVGCEVALLYLNKLNKEISEAIRGDSGGHLDPLILEDYRVRILKDMVLLKERMNNLKRDLGDATRQLTRASNDSFIEKTATTPRVQLVATPFERAIAGILINSVVSAGHPFEDVYDYLNNKYAFSERDELSIMQLVMDSGHHIFKDRGSIGSKFNKDDLDSGGNVAAQGLDFIKNYFA